MVPGTKTTLGILRDGKRKDVRVTLGELDPSLLPGASQQPMPRGPQGRADTAANPLGLVGQDLDADDRRQAGLESGEGVGIARMDGLARSEKHTSELQSQMRISFAVFCLKKKKISTHYN